MKWVLRVLMGIAAVLVLAGATLWGMGLRKDAGVMHASIEIARPPVVVWRWITDSDKLKAWVGWLVEIREVGPHHDVWVMEDRNNGNARVEIDGTSTLEDAPRRLEAHTVTAGQFEGDESFLLTDLGGRTRLEMVSSFHFSHWFARLMEPVISYEAHAKMVDDLARLKTKVETVDPELTKLQGTWNVVSLEMNGKAVPMGSGDGPKLIIAGDHFTSRVGNQVSEGTIEVNASASPKTFDLIYEKGPGTPNRSLAIYEINGNHWKSCFTAVPNTPRPKEFATAPGNGVVLDTLERQ
jgi:uncharacterized protein (TIGR03067 family)